MRKLTSWQKLLLYIVLLILFIIACMHYLPLFFQLQFENYLTIISFIFLGISALLLFFQTRINFRFNKRKAAFDFIYGNVAKELVPLLKNINDNAKVANLFELYNKHSLEDIVNKNSLSMSEDDKIKFTKLIVDVLNFYERMSIGIYKQVLDDDICYDDIGFNLIHFFAWVEPYIVSLRRQYKEERLFSNVEDLAEKWETYYLNTKSKNKREFLKMKRKLVIKDGNI